jgi:hypothetical protein
VRDRREVLRHRERIAFETGVMNAARTARGTWDVTLDDGRRPRFPGRFDAHS